MMSILTLMIIKKITLWNLQRIQGAIKINKIRRQLREEIPSRQEVVLKQPQQEVKISETLDS